MSATQEWFWSNTLSLKGIVWKISKVNDRAAFTYQTIRISWDKEAGCYQVLNHLNQVVFHHPASAACLENATGRILDVLSLQFVPIWQDESEEIPVIWDVAA